VGFQAPAQPLPPPAPATGRAIAGFLGKLLVVLLVLGIVGGASLVGYNRCQQLRCWQTIITAKSTALPTITPIPGFANYRNAALGVFLEYPQGWQQAITHHEKDTQYQGIRFSISNFAWVEVGSSPQYATIIPDQMNTTVIQALQALPTVKDVQTGTPDPPTVHIDGQEWTAEDAVFTLKDGTVLRLTTLALLYKGRGYVIFYQSHQDEFMHFSAQYYEPMLLSFRFLNG
jgi:hypothetical protein